ncbi:hypothetical protein EVAR_47352_1 [Eumeta japonica]|uniref:Uncharacterized protein n=1 Tax=Eumeta variegata TaxID=151549 RepID=A0A4C1WUC3_EUMVA|nr:hypothetical protein EVAR_47352_1 [Eumeta japonica]
MANSQLRTSQTEPIPPRARPWAFTERTVGLPLSARLCHDLIQCLARTDKHRTGNSQNATKRNIITIPGHLVSGVRAIAPAGGDGARAARVRPPNVIKFKGSPASS